MGIRLTTYVGPYYCVPKDFQWNAWEHIVCDGRMEAGTNDDVLYLIPNCKLPGIGRCMRVDPHGQQDVAHISPATIVVEGAAFSRQAASLVDYCDDNGIELIPGWGVIPCWM